MREYSRDRCVRKTPVRPRKLSGSHLGESRPSYWRGARSLRKGKGKGKDQSGRHGFGARCSQRRAGSSPSLNGDQTGDSVGHLRFRLFSRDVGSSHDLHERIGRHLVEGDQGLPEVIPARIQEAAVPRDHLRQNHGLVSENCLL